MVLFTGFLWQNWLHKAWLKVPLHVVRLVTLESSMFHSRGDCMRVWTRDHLRFLLLERSISYWSALCGWEVVSTLLVVPRKKGQYRCPRAQTNPSPSLRHCGRGRAHCSAGRWAVLRSVMGFVHAGQTPRKRSQPLPGLLALSSVAACAC